MKMGNCFKPLSLHFFSLFFTAESDICTFSLRTIHFKSSHPITNGLFTSSTRPKALQKIYENAVPTPVHTIRQLDRFRRDGNRSSKFFICTPVLGGGKKKYKKIDLEIETRKVSWLIERRRKKQIKLFRKWILYKGSQGWYADYILIGIRFD